MATDVDVIVPDHGPVGTKRELAETRAYPDLMASETWRRHTSGMSAETAAADINVGRFAAWTNPEPAPGTPSRLYAEFDGTITPTTDVVAQNQAVAEYNRLIVSGR